MKKKLITAGAASLAVAAMPMVGVFAVTDVVSVADTLQITVSPACSINGETTMGATTDDQTYTATLLNGAIANLTNGSGTTHAFEVICNNNAGWKVTAGAPSNLTPPSEHTTNAHVISYQAAALPEANSQPEGQWSATVTGTVVPATAESNGIADASGHIKTSGGIIATQAPATAGSSFTVTYGAYVGTQTAADTYAGTVTYTLATL